MSTPVLAFFASHVKWQAMCLPFVSITRREPLLGKHIITEFIHDVFVSIKAAMDLLYIAILLQLRCAYFYCPVNRAQARATFMGLVLGGEERHNKRKIGKVINYIFIKVPMK